MKEIFEMLPTQKLLRNPPQCDQKTPSGILALEVNLISDSSMSFIEDKHFQSFGALQFPIIHPNCDVTNRFPAYLSRHKVWFRPPDFIYTSKYSKVLEYRIGFGAFYEIPKPLI